MEGGGECGQHGAMAPPRRVGLKEHGGLTVRQSLVTLRRAFSEEQSDWKACGDQQRVDTREQEHEG